MKELEGLGVFYLGRRYDLAARARLQEPLLYDSRDLLTHALCVGMTGSGKTGLCLSLIEEAALDGVPAIVIDPKGDLCNLLLTFPNLSPQEFRPWIDEQDAANAGLSPDELAAKQAATWKAGLAEWGQDGARIQRLEDAADFAIYTPGSSAGLPVSIVASFAAPDAAARADDEALRERVSSTATGLLTLLGVDADPLQSREHILISTLLSAAWSRGDSLDLAALIARIQAPQVDRIGVVELESFFPAKERFALAMRLNNLLAAPGFSTWLQGEPLELGSMLRTPAGKPRVAIFSIAHLADAERMFFVTLLLNQTLAWMRAQSGTSSLRAILYMDEIAGYFPPVAAPPSKPPLLTLLKQGRAFGLGVVLATQNPVDLDYRGLANIGSWFLGRLQTERDKARVLEGLEGAAAGTAQQFDRARMEQLLAGLGKRVFLLHDVHEPEPIVFETRWALSYLRGPLTRAQIKALMDPRRGAPAERRPTDAAAAPGPAADRPALPPEIPQLFLPLRGSADPIVYRPALLGVGEVHYTDDKTGVSSTQPVARVAAIADGVDWGAATDADFALGDLESSPASGASFEALLPLAAHPKSYSTFAKDLASWIYRERSLTLLRSAATKLSSRPGESEADFRGRLGQASREARDAASDKLRQKYQPKLEALQERLRRAQQAVTREKEQSTQAGVQTAISVGATVLGALFGRKKLSASTLGKATTAARHAGRTVQQASDVQRAEESASAIEQKIAQLDAELRAELDAVVAATDPAAETLETWTVRAKKSDIAVRQVALLWMPYRRQGADLVPAWR